MKLRNKRTGEIGELAGAKRLTVYEPDMPLCGNSILGVYDTLAELNKEWEDYIPKEPLIKDEKIRKALRAWAEANSMTCCHYECGEFEQEYAEIGAGISFGGKTDYLEERHYTIAELCGEEEE